MTFKKFVDKARNGQLTSADIEGIADIRVPSAEGLVSAIGAREIPPYSSTIRIVDPKHHDAVERALRSSAL
jgi:hypothetical protein